MRFGLQCSEVPLDPSSLSMQDVSTHVLIKRRLICSTYEPNILFDPRSAFSSSVVYDLEHRHRHRHRRHDMFDVGYSIEVEACCGVGVQIHGTGLRKFYSSIWRSKKLREKSSQASFRECMLLDDESSYRLFRVCLYNSRRHSPSSCKARNSIQKDKRTGARSTSILRTNHRTSGIEGAKTSSPRSILFLLHNGGSGAKVERVNVCSCGCSTPKERGHIWSRELESDEESVQTGVIPNQDDSEGMRL